MASGEDSQKHGLEIVSFDNILVHVHAIVERCEYQ